MYAPLPRRSTGRVAPQLGRDSTGQIHNVIYRKSITNPSRPERDFPSPEILTIAYTAYTAHTAYTANQSSNFQLTSPLVKGNMSHPYSTRTDCPYLENHHLLVDDALPLPTDRSSTHPSIQRITSWVEFESKPKWKVTIEPSTAVPPILTDNTFAMYNALKDEDIVKPLSAAGSDVITKLPGINNLILASPPSRPLTLVPICDEDEIFHDDLSIIDKVQQYIV
ncbi:hypothetical protein E0Z10_g3595 [Xylaria hypoxylon]|uniref:Uncharacterized protein n=1 Tax=Xylaria hypoxylon TaxID=37992 RepID=A0A4Z0YN25_9PEZI|nr:hypothetical protein E0Z10_g3595 [Xylaria hypoxylon]